MQNGVNYQCRLCEMCPSGYCSEVAQMVELSGSHGTVSDSILTRKFFCSVGLYYLVFTLDFLMLIIIEEISYLNVPQLCYVISM